MKLFYYNFECERKLATFWFWLKIIWILHCVILHTCLVNALFINITTVTTPLLLLLIKDKLTERQMDDPWNTTET